VRKTILHEMLHGPGELGHEETCALDSVNACAYSCFDPGPGKRRCDIDASPVDLTRCY